MLQNCSKLPLIATTVPTMHSCNCAYLSLWRLKCPRTPAMNGICGIFTVARQLVAA